MADTEPLSHFWIPHEPSVLLLVVAASAYEALYESIREPRESNVLGLQGLIDIEQNGKAPLFEQTDTKRSEAPELTSTLLRSFRKAFNPNTKGTGHPAAPQDMGDCLGEEGVVTAYTPGEARWIGELGW